MKLLTIRNTKTSKGDKKGYLTGILHLSPHRLNEKRINVCPYASQGCIKTCLNTAGRGQFNSTQASRQKKTEWFLRDRQGFLKQLIKDIEALNRKAKRENKIPVVRLNGTSDLPWERFEIGNSRRNIFELFTWIQFYDYTKNPIRANQFALGKMPKNYDLTFSRSEENEHGVRGWKYLFTQGIRVAFVFDSIPEYHLGVKVVNGEENDLRFLDHFNVFIGLKAKGKARKDTSGFVIKTNNLMQIGG